MIFLDWNWPTRIASVLGVGLVAAAVLFPVIARRNEPRRDYCRSNLKQIGLGVRQYMQDYDEKLPLISTGGRTYGWADSLQPYLKSEQLFQCPLEKHPLSGNARQSGYTDYYFNSGLDGREEAKIGEPAQIIMLGDGNDGIETTDARYTKSGLSQAWRDDWNSPLYRHREGGQYAFVDGHVKWLKPEEVSNQWTKNGFYFEIAKR